MKREELKILSEIRKNINDGKIYGEYIKPSNPAIKKPVFWDVLRLCEDKDFIRYRHYGSAVVRNEHANVRWVIVHIFGMLPSEFVKRYIMI